MENVLNKQSGEDSKTHSEIMQKQISTDNSKYTIHKIYHVITYFVRNKPMTADIVIDAKRSAPAIATIIIQITSIDLK